VPLLLENGADIAAKSKIGSTALHKAAANSNQKI
jgi:ankyrin repeat protein